MPDDQIQQSIWEQLQNMATPIESMVLNWNKNSTEYVFEIVFVGKMKGVSECQATDEKARCYLEIGYANSCDYNALNRLIMAGRRLYFRFREDSPMLQRDLSKYKYFVCR